MYHYGMKKLASAFAGRTMARGRMIISTARTPVADVVSRVPTPTRPTLPLSPTSPWKQTGMAVPRPGTGRAGLAALIGMGGMGVRRPPLHHPRFYSSGSRKTWDQSFKSKLEEWEKLKTLSKVYVAEAKKTSACYMVLAAHHTLFLVKGFALHVAKEVQAGLDALNSQIYLYCCAMGFVLAVMWCADVLKLPSSRTMEGNDIDLDNLVGRLEELIKKFPLNVAVGVLYAQVFVKVLKEVANSRRELVVAIQKKFEQMGGRIDQLEAENKALKAEVYKNQKMSDELASQLEELKTAVSKTKPSES